MLAPGRVHIYILYIFIFRVIFIYTHFNWAVLSDEQMSNAYPFSLVNDEQMSNKVGVKHQPVNHMYMIYSTLKMTDCNCHVSSPKPDIFHEMFGT